MPLKGFCGVGADWVRRTIPNPAILSVNCFMSRSEIEAVDAADAADFAESDIVLVSASTDVVWAVSLLVSASTDVVCGCLSAIYIWATVQKVCREREMRKTSKQSRLFSISIHTPWIKTFYCVCEFAEKTGRSIIQSQIVAYSNSSKWFRPFKHPHDMIPVSLTSPPSSPASAHCFNRFP